MATLAVANTILEQLGGRRFIAMTGARQFVGSASHLAFRVPNLHIHVTLDPSDTYTIRTYDNRGRAMRIREMVYADQLQTVFTALTGLYTSL